MADSKAVVERARRLVEAGVVIPCPEAVEVGADIDPSRIARGVIINVGSRILGAQTSIGPACVIGAEGPATIENCQLARRVQLKGGYFSGAVFLDGSSFGSSAHVRPGTLLEEEANAAHAVGFKQTVLLPFATAGSLINFCDCLMAGGTSRKDHSEIGSSYIHFNFTPHQDKATASLLGDVPRGVMLDQRPIFMGGQGGLVGPVRIAYGTVIPAGTICRQDVLDENRLFVPKTGPARAPQGFTMGLYRSIQRIVRNNLTYIGNIRALQAWYHDARTRLMNSDPFARACHAGALIQLDTILDERLKRLKELAGKMPLSLQKAKAELGKDLPSNPYGSQEQLIRLWPEMEARLTAGPPAGTGSQDQDRFLSEWERIDKGLPYPEAIRQLNQATRSAGTAWLQAIVDATVALWPDG